MCVFLAFPCMHVFCTLIHQSAFKLYIHPQSGGCLKYLSEHTEILFDVNMHACHMATIIRQRFALASWTESKSDHL